MEKVKSDYIDPEKYNFIIDLMRPDNANALRVCLHTGLRINDVLSLKKTDLADDGTITTVCSKTKKRFTGKIPVNLAKAIKWRARRSEWLFPSPKPECKGQHRTRQAVWSNIKRAARLFGETRNATPHSARKIHAVQRYRKKGMQDAQEALQHDRLTTTFIYAYSDLLSKAEEERKAEEARKAAEQKTSVRPADEAYFSRVENQSKVFADPDDPQTLISNFLRGLADLVESDRSFVDRLIYSAEE